MFKQLLKKLKKLKRQLLYYNSYLSAKSSIAVFRASKMTSLVKMLVQKHSHPSGRKEPVPQSYMPHRHHGMCTPSPHLSLSLLALTHTRLKNIQSSTLGRIQNLSNTLKFNVKTRAETLILSFNSFYCCLHPIFSNNKRTFILIPIHVPSVKQMFHIGSDSVTLLMTLPCSCNHLCL